MEVNLFVFYYITVRSTLFLLLISCGAVVLYGQGNDSPLFALPYSPSLGEFPSEKAFPHIFDFSGDFSGYVGCHFIGIDTCFRAVRD